MKGTGEGAGTINRMGTVMRTRMTREGLLDSDRYWSVPIEARGTRSRRTICAHRGNVAGRARRPTSCERCYRTPTRSTESTAQRRLRYRRRYEFCLSSLVHRGLSRDTRHLTPMRHGVYLLLLAHCWDQKGPVPLDEQEAAGIANCRSADEIDALRYILDRYFVRMDDGWYNRRMVEEIARAETISDTRRKGALEGVRLRRAAVRQAEAEHERSTSTACPGSPIPTPNTTTTSNPTPTPTAYPPRRISS